MIKWFDSKSMTGIPELTNTQGDLVKMLNGLLVNGVNQKSITSVSYANGVCTLNVGANHGFVLHSVISVSNSNQASLNNKDFRIKGLTVTTISFDSSVAIANEVGLTVRYAPLGWTQHFASEGRSCYQSTDIKYPAYLRVDDTKFSFTNDNAAKFASVEICAGMTSFDSASWQAPYNANYPEQNRAYIGGRSNGWFKWYYASAYANPPDTVASPTGRREYILVGDGSQFWLILYPYIDAAQKDYAAVVGMPLLNYGKYKKQALVATQGFNFYFYPHESFLNTVRTCIAPYLSDVLSTAQGKPNYSFPLKDMLLRTPVFALDEAQYKILSSVFDGSSMIPNKIDGGVMKTASSLLLVAPYDDSVSIALDIGDL